MYLIMKKDQIVLAIEKENLEIIKILLSIDDIDVNVRSKFCYFDYFDCKECKGYIPKPSLNNNDEERTMVDGIFNLKINNRAIHKK